MAGLADLAQGLRLAGGVLSPTIGQQNARQDELAQRQAQEMQLAQIQQTVRGIEAGAIDPEAGRAALRQMGFNAPVGPGPEAMARQEALTQRRQMLEAMKNLPPDASQERRLAAMAPYMTPEQQIRLYDTTVNKAATLEAQLERLRNDYELRSRDIRRREDADLLEARFTAAELGIKQQIADLKAITGATGDKPPSGYRFKAGGGALEFIPGGPADPAVIAEKKPPGAGGKLPAEIQRMNIAMGALDRGLDSYEQLLKDFNPRDPRDQMNPATRARAEALVADMQLQAKEAQALGALTGPDVDILNKLLRNPATMGGAYYGKEGLAAQLKEARSGLERRRASLKDIYGDAIKGRSETPPLDAPAAPPPAAPAAPPTGLLGVTGANPSTQVTIGGRPQATGSEADEARAAIAAGADPTAVRKRFKQRTGQDL